MPDTRPDATLTAEGCNGHFAQLDTCLAQLPCP